MGNFASSRRAWFHILAAVASLTFINTNCQTPNSLTAKEKAEDVLEKQKNLIRNQLDEGKPESALALLRQILHEHPKDPSLLNLMGITHLALKNPKRAINHFMQSYKINHLPGTALNLSSAFIEDGDYPKATKLLNALIGTTDFQSYQHRDRVYHNLGYANHQSKNLSKAEKWYREAIEENPSFFPSYLELARLYDQSNKTQLAIATYRRAVDHCLSCFEPIYALTMLYIKSNQLKDARKLVLSYSKNDNITQADRSRARDLLRVVMNDKPKANL